MSPNRNLAKMFILNYWDVVYALLAGYFLFDKTYTELLPILRTAESVITQR